MNPSPRMRSLLLAVSFLTLLPVSNVAQTEVEPSQLKVLVGGMLQRPVTLSIEDLRSRHNARHLFLGVSYQRPIGINYRLGLGAGLSWGSYGVSVTGQVADSTGTFIVSEASWTRPVWYPFTRGFSGPFAYRTDPFQLWAELVRTINSENERAWWEISAMVGAASPIGIYWSMSSSVPPISETVGSPARAATNLGDEWHAMVGLAFDRTYRLKDKNRLSLGMEWRYSLDSYSLTELIVWPLTPNARTIQRRPHFMWIGVRAGYSFTWGSTRKPRWMRQLEQRDLPVP
jgi:hypothetical protein